MTYAIEKGVPIPGPFKYNWTAMEVGDSFFIPITKSTDPKLVSIRSAASHATRTNAPMRWSVRRVEGGHRAWRIA